MATTLYGPETAAFRREFADATDRLMRRRVQWFIAIWGGLNLLFITFDVWTRFGPALAVSVNAGSRSVGSGVAATAADWSIWQTLAYIGTLGGWIAAYLAVLGLIRRRGLVRRRAIQLSLVLVIADGLVPIIFRAANLDDYSGVWAFGLSHLIASMVFFWSPRDAIKPAIVVLSINAISRVTIEDAFGLFGDEAQRNALLVAFALVASPLLVVPGTMICWLRHSRRLEKSSYAFLQRRYGSLRQELAYARAVHESLFPAPLASGPVRFVYEYEPMRQIGGDFLHAHSGRCAQTGGPCLSVVILDVTGHGIPAALTVNRLHGEIELLFADDPTITPGQVLAKLNRYVHLTLSKHSLYATAVCVRINPSLGTIEHASGGHPPAFLLGADGSIDELRSTAVLLGAVPDAIFEPAMETRRFGPGDAVLAYTDGVTEARNEEGRMVRIDGLRELVRRERTVAPGERAQHVLSKITEYRGGLPPEDDALVVEVFRPVGTDISPEADAAAGSRTSTRTGVAETTAKT